MPKILSFDNHNDGYGGNGMPVSGTQRLQYDAYLYGLTENTEDTERRRMLHTLSAIADSELLTGRQRDALHYRYVDRLKLDEIADRMECGRPTVSKHIKKARATIALVMGLCYPRLERGIVSHG